MSDFGPLVPPVTSVVSTSANGLAPTLPNDATKYLNGVGGYTVPAGGGGGGDVTQLVQVIIGTSTSPITGIGGIVATFTAAGLTLSSIPATYSKLVIDVIGRSASALTSDNIIMQFNGDTGANYSAVFIEAVASAPIVGTTAGTASPPIINIPGSTTPANFASSGSIEIPGYTSVAFFKSAFGQCAGGVSVSPIPVYLALGLYWTNTAAINAIKLLLASAGNFSAGTTFTVYGFK